MSSSVLVVAAETSSCLYAQRLLELWQKEETSGLGEKKIEAFGIGNQAMVDLGFRALGRAEELAVVGVQEVVRHLPQIRRTFNALLAECQRVKPKLALLLDYPDFNFRLAKRLKALKIPVVYYISPQLWAWRTGRIELVKKYVDQMLVLFPFEKQFYAQHGVRVEFVGHPLLDEIERGALSPERRIQLRERFGLSKNKICLGLMPGSRRSEIKYNLATQLRAAEILRQKHSELQLALLVAPGLSLQWVRSQLGQLPFELSFWQSDPAEMIQLTDLVLCASGTATLMVGLAERPMVIMYRMNIVSAQIARLLVRNTRYFGMVNLISGEAVVPEFFQTEATPERLAQELSNLLTDPARLQIMRGKLAQLKHLLGERGATERVHGVLKEYLV